MANFGHERNFELMADELRTEIPQCSQGRRDKFPWWWFRVCLRFLEVVTAVVGKNAITFTKQTVA